MQHDGDPIYSLSRLQTRPIRSISHWVICNKMGGLQNTGYFRALGVLGNNWKWMKTGLVDFMRFKADGDKVETENVDCLVKKKRNLGFQSSCKRAILAISK